MAWDADYVEGRLTVPDGRTVAWTDWGDPESDMVLLRIPGMPSSRWAVRADTTPWLERGLRVVTTERPGYGASTRLPGRGFFEHADDLAQVLDHLGLHRVLLIGGSGAAPHELALCQRHPDRVTAATVISGAAPVTDRESEAMIPLNRKVADLVRAGDRDGVRATLADMRDLLLADPLATFAAVMDTAPAEDLEIIREPNWRAAFSRAVTEALGQGVDGWADEALAIYGPWDTDPTRVETSITWFHATNDRNTPIEAAQRLAESLPNGRLVQWHDAGHLTGYRRERELLDELIARGGTGR